MAGVADALARSVSFNAELMIHALIGEAFWAEIEMIPFACAGEPVSHWVIVGRDITERRAAAAEIHRSAYYDLLTGLPNRRLLMEHLDALVAKTPVDWDVGAVLYLYVDNFKNVNDFFGHATGDVLLAHAAARLHQCMRPCDVVARIGGDEFVVLINELGPNPTRATEFAFKMAQTIREALAAPIDLNGQHYTIAVSMGLTLVYGLLLVCKQSVFRL
jgi:diguanylate cyclase (GGDEF)-like protein